MTSPPCQHDYEVVARSGNLTLHVCRTCGMRRVSGLGDGLRVPGDWVQRLSGKTDVPPANADPGVD